jgi:hypothetical protein
MESGQEKQPGTNTEKQVAQKRLFYRTEFKVALFLGLCIGASVYLLLHLAGKLGSMGQEGSNVAQVWSFIIAILELGASITAIVISLIAQKKGARRSLSSKEKRAEIAKNRPTFIVIGVIAALLAFAVPPVVNKWTFRHISSQNITTKIELAHNTGMVDGDSAQMVLPTTRHKTLLLTFQLKSEQETGSCVAPARMKVDITYNGNEGQTLYDVTSGSQQKIDLGDMSQPADLTVSLKNDPYCKVRITIGSATYRN